MTRATVYARYSTEEQNPRSLEDQIARCAEFAERKGLVVGETYDDAAASGTHTDRPGLQRLLAAVGSKRRPFDVVLVDDLSRLSRNQGDFWRVCDEIAASGARVIDVQTGLASDEPNARMMFGMKAMFADAFVEQARWQTRRGLQARARDKFSTGGVKYGFRTVVEDGATDPEHARKRWVIHEPEAVVVRRIYELRLEGFGLRRIASILNTDKTPIPRAPWRGPATPAWHHATVRRILANPLYVGRVTWGQHSYPRVPGSSKRRRVTRSESEHVVHEVPELAIVDRATWDSVQKCIEQRGRGARRGETVYTITGLCRCGTCGGSIGVSSITYTPKARHVRFGCARRQGSACTNGKTFIESTLLDALTGALRALLATPAARAAFTRAFIREATATPVSATDRADLDRQLATAKRRVANTTRLLVDDPDDADLRAQRLEHKTDVARIERELDAATPAAKRSAPPSIKEVTRAAEQLASLIERHPAEARNVLLAHLSPVVVTPLAKPTADGKRFKVTTTLAIGGCVRMGSAGPRSRQSHTSCFDPAYAALTLPLAFAA